MSTCVKLLRALCTSRPSRSRYRGFRKQSEWLRFGAWFAIGQISSKLCHLINFIVIDVINMISFQIHGGGDHGGGVAHTVADLLAYIERLVSQEPADIFASIMPGVTQLANLHPLLVHFPIALLTVFFLLDLLASLAGKKSWRDAAGMMLYFGTIGAALAVFAGFIAADSVAHGDDVHDIMTRHQYFGVSVLTLATLLSLWRLLAGGIITGAANVFFLTLSGLLCLLLTLGADLGGLMVYRYGVAVDSRAGGVPASTAHSHEHSGHHH